MWPKFVQLWHHLSLWWGNWCLIQIGLELQNNKKKSGMLHKGNLPCHIPHTDQQLFLKNQIPATVFFRSFSLEILAPPETQYWALRSSFCVDRINWKQCNSRSLIRTKEDFQRCFHFSNGGTTASSMNAQKSGILWVTMFSFMHKLFTTNYALLTVTFWSCLVCCILTFPALCL